MTVAVTPEVCEWYTPDWILDIVYSCFDVDVDPCSPVQYQNVKAAVHYTKESNGLDKEWNGNVFMNCPYGRELPVWIDKLLEEVGGGRTKNAICLLPVKADTKWFNLLTDSCKYWVSIRGRVKFKDYYGGYSQTGTFASGLFLISKDPDVIIPFIDRCKEIGKVWKSAI